MFNRSLFSLTALFFAVGFGTTLLYATAAQSAKEETPLHHVSSSACGSCHQKIYKQWSGSMHANSTAIKDPIHGSFYQMLVGDPTQEGLTTKDGKYPNCLQCHAPNAARDQKTKLDEMAAYSEGVNCVACHTIRHAKGPIANSQLGAQSYDYSTTALQGPNGAFSGSRPAKAPGGNGSTLDNPFAHEAQSSLFRSSELCLGCHESRNNGKGIPVCATGPEVVKSGNTVTCQSCHMPVVDGVVDHFMAGGHSPEMVKRGLSFSISGVSSKTGAQATVHLKNHLAHNLPTGAPFRNLFITVVAYDAKGETVWSNYKTSPFAEDTKSVLMLFLVDDDGKPVPPPMATKIAQDSRLTANESRDIVYDIPVLGVAKIRAEIRYDLLPPALKNKFAKTIPESLREPALIAIAETGL
ncbi:MAG: cytochrome c family protein [Magnetococcales bacterium]|nr:cytochrome c family protein [Magnetococcales bacterium]